MTPAGAELERAIRDALVPFRASTEVEELVSRPWASITFSGERHRLVLRLGGDCAAAAANAFLDGLAEREFQLRGHIVADIAVVGDVREGDSVRLSLEALTVEAT